MRAVYSRPIWKHRTRLPSLGRRLIYILMACRPLFHIGLLRVCILIVLCLETEPASTLLSLPAYTVAAAYSGVRRPLLGEHA